MTLYLPYLLDACRDAHNKLRLLHENTPKIEWDDSLAAKAQQYAHRLVEINRNSPNTKLIHEIPDHGLGENLYWRDNSEKGTCADASLDWYVYFHVSSHTKIPFVYYGCET